MAKKDSLHTTKALAIIGGGTTLAINPWFAYDPINLPKMLFLSTGAAYLLGLMIIKPKFAIQVKSPLLILVSTLFIFLIISLVTNEAPWYQQLWGTWGRSTGLLTYFSLLVILLAAYLSSSTEAPALIRVSIERVGYFVSCYTFLQMLDLDPINWAQKSMIATLGNINFMSTFLGLTTISYTSRIITKKQSFSSRLFFFLIAILNLVMIWISQSIQGIGVLLAGQALLLAFFLRSRYGIAPSIFSLLSSTVVGVFIFLGTAGLGPIAAIRQETVVFRIDYWVAGLKMLGANLLNGVGLDSYGDFYRPFRSLEAVTRTGPQRVTNTAHNIFLDVATGAGLFAGLLFAVIMLYTAFAIIRSLISNPTNVDLPSLSAMWLGFIVFCLISINQIGVGVWGFLITGLICGYDRRARVQSSANQPESRLDRKVRSEVFRIKSNSSSMDEKPRSERLRGSIFHSLLVTLFFACALIPNVSDALFLNSMKKSNPGRALELVDVVGVQDFHLERLIQRLDNLGMKKEELGLALTLVDRNPQNFVAWVAIANNQLATDDNLYRAVKNLSRLDPNNGLLQENLNLITKNR